MLQTSTVQREQIFTPRPKTQLCSLWHNWQKLPKIIFWEEGISVWMPTNKIVSGMGLDILYYPRDSWKNVTFHGPWSMQKHPSSQQKKRECPCSGRHVGMCMGIGVICLWSDLGEQGLLQGRREGTDRAGGLWDLPTVVMFVPDMV